MPIVIFLLFALPLVAIANDEFKFVVADNAVELEDGLCFDTGRLLYRAPDGVLDETKDTYLIVFRGKGYPQVIDRIQGHSAVLKLHDLNDDGAQEVLLFYHAGGNQYQLKVYLVRETDYSQKHIDFQDELALSSNMGSIQVTEEGIVVKNLYRQNSDEAAVVWETFRLVEGTFVSTRRSEERVKGGGK